MVGPLRKRWNLGHLTEADEHLERRLKAASCRLFGRSLHVRHVDSGSCNGCEFEAMALLNPLYDMQRFGLDFVASPRHADLLLVTGGVTRNLEQAVVRTFEATPLPKLLVAVGACALDGGMIGPTYANRGGVDKLFPVTVYVPGCPPSPMDILDGMVTAVERAEEWDSQKRT
jgi:Ni,Fe-hydrogenase III small subunit